MDAPLLRRSAEEAKAAAPSFNKEPEQLSFIMIELKLKWKVDVTFVLYYTNNYPKKIYYDVE